MPPFISHVSRGISYRARSISTRAFQRILDRGIVPGPFNFHYHDVPGLGREGQPLKSGVFHAIRAISERYKNQLNIVFQKSDVEDEEKIRYRESVDTLAQKLLDSANPSQFSRQVPGPPRRKAEVALRAVVLLLRHSPKRLCTLLPILYADYYFEGRLLQRTMLYLFYHFLGQSRKMQEPQDPKAMSLVTFPYNPSVTYIPEEFYHALLHKYLGKQFSGIMKCLPAYTLIQACPPHLRNAEQFGLLESGHWEQSLFEIQTLCVNGDWQQAFVKSIELSLEQKFSLEFLNTIHLVFDQIEKENIHEEDLLIVIQMAIGETSHHFFVWERLIDLALHAGNKRCIEFITASLTQTSLTYMHRVLIRLIEARNKLGLPPLHPDTHPLVDKVACKNLIVATLLMQSWINYHNQPTANTEHNGKSHLYSILTPFYSRYFKTSILTSLSLPCRENNKFSNQRKFREDGFAVNIMLYAYMKDNSFALDVTLSIYQRLREVLTNRPEIFRHLTQDNIAEIFVVFLMGIIRSKEKSLDFCMAIVSDIINILNTTKVDNGKDKKSTIRSWTWISLLAALIREGHVSAAEKVVEEIRRHSPNVFPWAATSLMRHYGSEGDFDKVSMLVTKLAAGNFDSEIDAKMSRWDMKFEREAKLYHPKVAWDRHSRPKKPFRPRRLK